MKDLILWVIIAGYGNFCVWLGFRLAQRRQRRLGR